MAGEWQRHVASAPVIATAAPFFCSRSIRLGRLAVVEEETWIALKRIEISAVRKNERCADEIAGPISAAFGRSSIQKHQILSAFGMRVIFIGSMKISEQGRRIFEWLSADVPGDVRDRWF